MNRSVARREALSMFMALSAIACLIAVPSHAQQVHQAEVASAKAATLEERIEAGEEVARTDRRGTIAREARRDWLDRKVPMAERRPLLLGREPGRVELHEPR